MFGPVYLDILTFFYPIGNTPAVCLTRDLPREGQGNILLLGCGDVRNILFTLYSEQSTSRNILLFSLALADTDGANHQIIWNIYYHLYLDEESLRVLNNQARELVSLSTSMREWHSTTYGRMLRFCDSSTFARVRALWKSYDMLDLEQEKRVAFNRLLEANIQRAKAVKAHYVGDGYVTTGTRSAAPLGVAFAAIAHQSYQHYWNHGSTSLEPGVLAETIHPNPLFAYHGTDLSTLHYGTDPLLGFHLATAFAPLANDSPFALGLSEKTPLVKVVEAARLQFRAWCNSLRLSFAKALTIRFFAGDAIAFAHALRHIGVTGDNQSTNIYQDAYHLQPIKLDGEDYSSTKKAPLSFTVIDTSNLIDHLGAVNLLSAASPLLKNDLSSSLYTESLVKRESNYQAYIECLLCGDFSTMSLLLDLFPVEYWTNASSSSTADDVMFDTVLRLTGADKDGQMRVRLTWKRSIPLRDSNVVTIDRRLQFDEIGLAHVLHNVYQNMFQHEDMLSFFSDLNMLKIKKSSILHYHRGSFGIFLRLVQSRVVVDWHKLMVKTLQLIETDSTIMMGHSYIQELYLCLHVLDLYSVETFSRTNLVRPPDASGIGGWEGLPEVVCITMKIPRKALVALTGPKPTDIGTPIAHCLVQSSPKSEVGRWQNLFSAVQIIFGKITTSGTRNSNDFALQITEDELRWKGNSPLVVSFNAPSWFLLLEPRTAIVAFGLQSTPYSSTKFMSSLGVEMNVYETTLGNEEDVYVTRYSPNLTGITSVHGFSGGERKPRELSNEEIKIAMTANVMRSNGQITSFTGRIDLLSDTLKEILRSGCAVKTTQTAPCEFTVSFKDGKTHMLLQFPAPVARNESRIRTARKSSYVEVEAPIHANAWITFPAFISSRLWDKTKTALSNMHGLSMDMLPVLDTTRHSQLQWLITHASGMFSARERRLREQSVLAMSGSRMDARVSFKDSLFSLFMHFTGLQGEQSRVFGLNDPAGGGVHILIFASCIRLDVGSQTVVLDTAVLPLTKSLVPRIERFLAAISNRKLCSIRVDGEELKVWRQVLPTFAERCRSWQHRSSCDHAGVTSQLTGDTNDVFCSCGHGVLPERFITGIPNWSDVARYTTRAAISPIFSVPVVDPPFDSRPSPSEGCRTCGKVKAANGGSLSKCGACHNAKYCSSDCQRADWKYHKGCCSKMKDS
ncbi:hypothetical protein K469DRAFT_607801 [Zopfia rhizophila CBS 207.26]|uniref:MYND-type domain-containing protein n=1 Tax=Zopfia rhizophila CBS 207.26 TaxID=1314779 RepID=A0A6A6DDD0_9PEZI|nr:hypothetical protein K469DRAFT_607801 [Zopfia rhizophila CBS 207.26]